MSNSIKDILINLGLSDNGSIEPFYPKVRDRNDISVLRCKKSGCIFLSSVEHMDISHYKNKESFKYWGTDDRMIAVRSGYEDNQRRFEQFKNIIVNKKWLDIGTGSGGILDVLAPLASETCAVEPQNEARQYLTSIGYNILGCVEDVDKEKFEVVTLFHVFEHLTDPIGTLEIIRNKMTYGGKLIIEVPHARDFLIDFIGLNEFKSFSLWSEHLILHTRESLRAFIAKSGFSNINISGFQRYPLANHLYWLVNKKPLGHILWNQLRTDEIDQAYANLLSRLDSTDTLIAIAEKV